MFNGGSSRADRSSHCEVIRTLFGGCFWTYHKYGPGSFKFLDGNCRYFPAGSQGLETKLLEY